MAKKGKNTPEKVDWKTIAAKEFFHFFSNHIFAGLTFTVVVCITVVLVQIGGDNIVKIIEIIFSSGSFMVALLLVTLVCLPIFTNVLKAIIKLNDDKVEKLGERVRTREEKLLSNRPTTEPHKKGSTDD